MASLTAIPTSEGLEVLNSELKAKATKFILIGVSEYTDQTLDSLLNGENLVYADIEQYVFYESSIHCSRFDDEGVLTLECIVPVEENLPSYMYAIGVITEDTNELVVLTKTPKIVPIEDVGGVFVIKVAVRGTAGEIVFKSSEYITVNEAQELFLKPVIANTNLVIALQNKLIEKGIIDG